jgi:NDP-sugar pyrophosphorylase family protein
MIDAYLEAIAREELVLGFDSTGYWSDIGTPERYAQAERDVALRRISLAARNDASVAHSPSQ